MKNAFVASAFVGGGRIEPDEERLVLSKPVVHFSLTDGVLRGLVCDYLTKITNLIIYCEKSYLCVTILKYSLHLLIFETLQI